MKLFNWLQQLVQYLGKGVARLLSAGDDDYPEVGIQPFEGEPYEGE